MNNTGMTPAFRMFRINGKDTEQIITQMNVQLLTVKSEWMKSKGK